MHLKTDVLQSQCTSKQVAHLSVDQRKHNQTVLKVLRKQYDTQRDMEIHGKSHISMCLDLTQGYCIFSIIIMLIRHCHID